MNHASNDVKQLLAIVSTFVAKSTKDILPPDFLKSMLVSFPMERCLLRLVYATAIIALS
jgi:hypothetical protein